MTHTINTTSTNRRARSVSPVTSLGRAEDLRVLAAAVCAGNYPAPAALTRSFAIVEAHLASDPMIVSKPWPVAAPAVESKDQTIPREALAP
jgi:hypothetical protein